MPWNVPAIAQKNTTSKIANEGLNNSINPNIYATIVQSSNGINSGQYLWPKLYL